jgi:hypothetical protein
VSVLSEPVVIERWNVESVLRECRWGTGDARLADGERMRR